jgi:hypothetical protein
MNTDTAQPISQFDPIVSGATINLATLPTQNLTIRANTSPGKVGSVEFDLVESAYLMTVNTPPYYLCASAPCSNLGVGLHSLTTTPYTGSNASGAAGSSMSISFSVIDPTPTPSPSPSPTPTPMATPTPPPNTLNLLTGSYSGCTNGIGSGCAKGDYRSGSNATVSTSSSTLTTPTGSFTSADIGKRGVAVDWNATNVAGCSSGYGPGYACYTGVSCPFTVSAVNSSASITVSPGSGCGSSGIGFNANGNGYWAVYTDDSSALSNALSAATGAGRSLFVPANYKGGILNGPSMPANANLQCAAGGTFYSPRLDASQTQILLITGTTATITGCTFSGTEPVGGAWNDPTRSYNGAITIFGGSNTLISGNTFENFWGTYAVGTSPATNITIDSNTFQNCAYYGVQFNSTGGSPGSFVTNNNFSDCNYGSEDGGAQPASVNISQFIEHNDMFPTNGGSGYNRSQTSLGLGTKGTVFMDPGLACSGGTCGSNEYIGVSLMSNHVHGPASAIINRNVHGATVSGNTCDSGCTYQ